MARITISPRGTNQPHDWRTAWAEFETLRSMGQKLGEPVRTWRLEAPTGFGKMLDKRWSVVYTFKGNTYNAYVGLTGTQAAAGIMEIAKGFRAALHAKLAYEKSIPKKKPAPKAENPVYDRHIVSKVLEEWRAAIVKVKDKASADAFQREHGYVNWFMQQRAGILPITMRHYLFSHPHARYWPTPPRDDHELQRRQRELEKIVAEKERRRTSYE
jgi:hypothetical protein